MLSSAVIRHSAIIVLLAIGPVASFADDQHAFLDPTEHPNRNCAICGGGTGVYWDSSYFWFGRHFVQEWKSGDERAGNPHCVSCLAVPNNGPHYDGYYVGGGNPCSCSADVRRCNEGTWGWDYVGCGWLPIVDLGYWHGRRDQTGNYKVDGPKICHHGE